MIVIINAMLNIFTRNQYKFIKRINFLHTFSETNVFEKCIIKNIKKADAKDGIKYEKKIEKYLEKIYPKNIKNENEISYLLNNFNKNIHITKLRGIDFIINDNNNKQIYALQIKIGSKTRTLDDCKKLC